MLPEHDRRRPGEERPQASLAGDTSTILQVSEIVRATRGLSEHVEHFQARVLQDALQEATASYWRRRAATFARVGNERCDEIAQACRNAATVALLQDEHGPEAVICRECGTPTSPWSCSCVAAGCNLDVDGARRYLLRLHEAGKLGKPERGLYTPRVLSVPSVLFQEDGPTQQDTRDRQDTTDRETTT
jgi:hypothetical protein